MKEWFIEHKFYVLLAIVISNGGLYYLFFNQPESKQSVNALEKNVFLNEKENKKEDSQSNIEKAETVIVDIKGQVNHPGVYQSNQEERVIDVIKKAGGFTSKANEGVVNLAARVKDEMVIYIPAKGEVISNQPANSISNLSSAGEEINNKKINLNTADETELQNIPGIGPSKAAAIAAYRKENGPFQSIEDIKNISGIGEKTFEKLKEEIVVQ